MKRHILIPVCIGIGMTSVAGNVSDKHPNIILILADDMGIGDIAFYNDGISNTPNLDKLIQEGVSFNQAYSSSPVSAPSRASLLTGMYPHRTGCVTINLQRFPELTRIKKEIPTIADIFKEQNYATGLVGKWHCGIGEGFHPMDRGFDFFEGFYGFDLKTYFNYGLTIGYSRKKVNNNYLTHDLNDRAIAFIKSNQHRPFFLHLAHSAPHRPLGAPEERIRPYLEKGLPRHISTIYAMIEIMDEGIGELLEELDRLNIRENTIVIFSSDNGADLSTGKRFNKSLKGHKYTVNEGGINVPFIVNWKGTLNPRVINETIHFTGVIPSLIEMCHLNQPTENDFDGVSFAKLMTDPNAGIEAKPYFWQWNRGVPEYSHNAAVRIDEWKLVRPYIQNGIIFNKSDKSPELYNLKNDPEEKNDVSHENRKIYEDLNVALEQWCREVENDRLNYK